MPLRTVAIVGRPNVGKSTLFNRVVGERRSVVHETAGVTRDRIVEVAEWTGHSFILMDTGGIIPPGESIGDFDALVTGVAQDAIEEADVVVLLVDSQVGPMDWDTSIATALRRAGRPVILAVNKVENNATIAAVSEFYSLGLGEPMPISAVHGRGVGDLLDRIVADFPEQIAETPCDCRIAIVGRPNVGKSSLLNRLVGTDAALVSDIPGTTRDAVHTDLKWQGKTMRLIDTAGLRRKGRVKEAIEIFSNMRAIRALEECDVALLLVDSERGTVSQDAKIAGLMHNSGRGVVVAFNKWDLVAKETGTHEKVWEEFVRQVPFLAYAPHFTFSALTKQRLGRALETIWQVHESRQRRIPTSELNEFIEHLVQRQQPRASSGGLAKIYYATQTGTAPPVIVLSVNEPRFMARNYLRYLNNKIRETYGFEGTRIFLKMKKH